MRHLALPVLAAAASVLGTAAASADVRNQFFELLARDGGVDDRFGWSVGISGTTAIVGSPFDFDQDGRTGSAFLFDTITGNPLGDKLLPDDGASFDRFGRSVGISGTTAIVGAPSHVHNDTASGSAYLVNTISGNPIELLPNDPADFDQFGFAVGISATTAVVGAYLEDENGSNSGSAYLFNAITGQQIDKLLPEDGAPGDNFGYSVAISGATVIVGALYDDDNGDDAGLAYLFDAAGGPPLTKLFPEEPAAGDVFGISVAISGTIAIVGATGNVNNGISSGAAYLFDTRTGKQTFKLLPEDPVSVGQFGVSVAISGTVAIVGAQGHNDNGGESGAAYLFDAMTGRQIAKLLPDDGARFDHFGVSTAISGDTAIVGAYHHDDNGNDSGSAYLFCAAACPPDINADGVVDATDLAILLGNWGPVPPNDPIADLNHDGVVGPADLATVLGAWGPCP